MKHAKLTRRVTPVAVLLVALVATACSGGNDATNTTQQATTSEAAIEGGPRCQLIENTEETKAAWGKADKAPNYFLRLTEQFDLPPQLTGLADPQKVDGFGGNYVNASFPAPNGGLVQYQDKTIGVILPTGRTNLGTPNAQMDVAVVSQDGGLVSYTHYVERDGQDLPKPFDLGNKQVSGYFRVGAVNGMDIPAAAAGDEAEKQYLTSVLADAFDSSVVWVLVRGSAKLYKASLFWSLQHGAPSDANCVDVE
ncbi:hypothetical protein GS449_14200 [Rhodococcus hoagii]|nr:hypothetical protein [Prescottella equi]